MIFNIVGHGGFSRIHFIELNGLLIEMKTMEHLFQVRRSKA
jgi:hypothetical protein